MLLRFRIALAVALGLLLSAGMMLGCLANGCFFDDCTGNVGICAPGETQDCDCPAGDIKTPDGCRPSPRDAAKE